PRGVSAEAETGRRAPAARVRAGGRGPEGAGPGGRLSGLCEARRRGGEPRCRAPRRPDVRDGARHGLRRQSVRAREGSGRQEPGLELIASENFATLAVMEAMGTALTNKYAEGLPRKRYYGGCEVVDEVEQLAIDRAKALFKAEHVNVQPHSGAQANMAAYLAVAKPGDTLLGLALSHGGHLTHGSPVNFSGTLFRATSYGVREDTGRIDYDQVREVARRERPRILVGGASAYARVIDFAALRSIADEVGAIFVVDMAHFAGLVAAGIHPSPVPHAQIVTTT